jgi:hypothetical protein
LTTDFSSNSLRPIGVNEKLEEGTTHGLKNLPKIKGQKMFQGKSKNDFSKNI